MWCGPVTRLHCVNKQLAMDRYLRDPGSCH